MEGRGEVVQGEGVEYAEGIEGGGGAAVMRSDVAGGEGWGSDV